MQSSDRYHSQSRVERVDASAAVLVDVSGFTITTNAIFTSGDEKAVKAFLSAWALFRNRYIGMLNAYGVGPAYPANRMGDGFITLFFKSFQGTKRIVHFVWRLNRFLDDLKAEISPYLPPECPGITHLKAAAVFSPEVYEVRVPKALVGNKTIDSKDYISPHLNLLARMLQFWHEEFAANSLIVPGAAPAFPEGYDITRRPLVRSLDALMEKMKGFQPEAIEAYLGDGGLDLVTIGKCAFD